MKMLKLASSEANYIRMGNAIPKKDRQMLQFRNF